MSKFAVPVARIIDAFASTGLKQIAVRSPLQKNFQELTYNELSEMTKKIASNLTKEFGYKRGDVLVSDLPNTTENLLLQIACSRLGVAYASVKNSDGLTTLQTAVEKTGNGILKGCISTSMDSDLSSAQLNHPAIIASDEESIDTFCELTNSNLSSDALEEVTDNTASTLPWGYFNSTQPLQHADVLHLAQMCSNHLNMTPEDRVCVSITLCHSFGIASACAASLLAGATIVLPAVGGILGCGVPSERAAATLNMLGSERCTLLFADSHILKALGGLPPIHATSGGLSHLRGGVVKVGSGSDFMTDTVKYGDVTLSTMSKL